MPKKRYIAEESIHQLREADVLHGQGYTVSRVCKQLSVADQTYYRWRKIYGGMRIDQAKRLQELEAAGRSIRWLWLSAGSLQHDPTTQRVGYRPPAPQVLYTKEELPNQRKAA